MIELDGEHLTLETFAKIVLHRAPVTLSDEAIQCMRLSREMVDRLIGENRTVYGITTGFGKLCDTVIAPEQSELLQLNLIRSHACGVGEPLSEEAVRGMMLLRANALAKGYSGVRPNVVKCLIEWLNLGLHPVVPAQGSLGASGDLTPLAHMILPLLGYGEVWVNGKREPAEAVWRTQGRSPLRLAAKEGLALINGTQMMTSLLALGLLRAKQLILAADIVGAMTVEALRGIPHAFHPLLHEVRGQIGQITTATNLRALLTDSAQVTQPDEIRVQDAYSLRCMPQVHGASKDAYHYVEGVVSRELNAATDNPLLFPKTGEAVSGGNFHGQPLALAADFLAIAMAELANISERRTERMVNPQLSGLPAFLTNQSGLHSGYMILQYVAASLVSENKGLCHPASVDSIPSSANQEDHVSMGATAARKLHQILDNVTRVLAVEYVCAGQALEFAKHRLGKGTWAAYRLLRQHIPPLVEDREGHRDIETAARLIQDGRLAEEVGKTVTILL
ncbi:histidine ammonia-lyase [Polycladomyces abyssicola]